MTTTTSLHCRRRVRVRRLAAVVAVACLACPQAAGFLPSAPPVPSSRTPLVVRQGATDPVKPSTTSQEELFQKVVDRFKSKPGGRQGRKKRIKFSSNSVVERVVSDVPDGRPFRDYMALPVEDYIVFDEDVMTKTPRGTFQFRIPTQAEGMSIVADVRVDQNLKQRRNAWSGTNFGFAFDPTLWSEETGDGDLQRYLQLANISGAMNNASSPAVKNGLNAFNENTTNEWLATQAPETREELISVSQRLLCRAIRFLEISAEGEAILGWHGPNDRRVGVKKTPGEKQCVLRAELSVKATCSYGAPAPGWQLPKWILTRLASLLLGAISANLLARAALALEEDYGKFATGQARGGGKLL